MCLTSWAFLVRLHGILNECLFSNYRTILFVSKQISSIVPKKIGPKSNIHPYCMIALNHKRKYKNHQKNQT